MMSVREKRRKEREMEFTTVVVNYEHPVTKESFTQGITLAIPEACEIYAEMLEYDGGSINPESSVFNLLTAVKYISRIQGFEQTPNFNILPPRDMTMVYDYIEKKKLN